MFYELISLGGYGAFVWPAFIFTLSSIFILFYISIKELKKNEKIYLAKIFFITFINYFSIICCFFYNEVARG